MSITPKDGAQASLTVFGSLVTEMVAADLPEGVSPDCFDVVFIPGSVASRPALQKVFATPFPGNVTTTYAKSFVTPTGDIENLYLDSAGNLWYEDLTNNPGVATIIGAVTPATYAKSITAFGREYIAVSDGLHGQEVPLQWDGVHLDRVTQDGPGTPPIVKSFSLPSVSMVASGFVSALTVTNVVTTGYVSDPDPGYYTTLLFSVASGALGLNPGDIVTVASNSESSFNASWGVVSILSDEQFIGSAYYVSLTYGTGGTATPTSSVTAQRTANVVTITTTAAHQLQVGYEALIAGLPASAIGGGISSIVINNEDNPGIATVTTNSAHGLVPNLFVSIQGVNGVVAGTTITSAVWAGGIVTVTTSVAHGLAPGSIVTIAATGGGAVAFNSTTTVVSVISSTEFTYALIPLSAPASATGGTVTLNWPIPDTIDPTYFEVLTAPTATTFQVQVNYSDGTWTTGTVKYAWDGTFFVSAVLSSTSFQYSQYGPDVTSTTVGTVTPWGQAAPGLHQCQVLFLTRQGYITAPSPPITFIADGGQYISVSNIPIGPVNIVSRILAFTGAGGAYFFYIPASAQINGQTVSTATQINDNITTSAILDFSDNTLFASLAISIPGNNLAAQLVLDSALSFGLYGSRLLTWGQRNTIQNLLNMGFDGGFLQTSPSLPTGWSVATGGPGGALALGHYGQGWQITGSGSLFQSFYEDAYGLPIGTQNTSYILRGWVQGGTATVTISSASTGFNSSATLTGTTPGSFSEAAFSQTMPSTIPSDMILSVSGTGSALVDELWIIYAEEPYLETVIFGSYVDSPEAFDAVTGKFGSSQDTAKVMDIGAIRQTLYFLTKDPSGRLHQTSDNGVTEPAGWQVNEVAASCGLLSTFALTKSQADNSSAAGGEEWFAWASSSGARIFSGDQPWKISQEIQPNWTGQPTTRSTDGSIIPGIDFGSAQTIWALNDPVERIIYFGIPVYPRRTGEMNAPQIILTMSYRELDTAYQIATSQPIHTSFTGHLIATDHTRKWAPWSVQSNGAALMYRNSGTLSVVLFGGNGEFPGGSAASYGNVYTLNPLKYTDDDYGQIYPYYVTYFFVSREQEQALSYTTKTGRQPLGSGRKMLQYMTAFISGIGQVVLTFFPDAVSNAWNLTVTRTLVQEPTFDLECGGGQCSGYRIAIRFASFPTSPSVTADNSFNLQRVVVFIKQAARLPWRGSST